MKRFLINLSFGFFALLGLVILGNSLLLIQNLFLINQAIGWAGLLFALTMFGFLALFPLMITVAALRRTGNWWQTGSRSHRRYIRNLARLFRRYRDTPGEDDEKDDRQYLSRIYIRMYEQSNNLLRSCAETAFYHTAISQSGRLDTLVVFRDQISLVRRMAELYYPRARARILFPLYADVAEALLAPTDIREMDMGAQIGPAIVGASVVGAIPGANLVSLIIADAVVQGSSNTVSMLRAGILARRYFHRMLEGGAFDPVREHQAVNEEALDILAPLIAEASSTLSRIIWDAARNHLKRVPTATYRNLKNMVAKSVRSVLRRSEDSTDELSTDDPADSSGPATGA